MIVLKIPGSFALLYRSLACTIAPQVLRAYWPVPGAGHKRTQAGATNEPYNSSAVRVSEIYDPWLQCNTTPCRAPSVRAVEVTHNLCTEYKLVKHKAPCAKSVLGWRRLPGREGSLSSLRRAKRHRQQHARQYVLASIASAVPAPPPRLRLVSRARPDACGWGCDTGSNVMWGRAPPFTSAPAINLA